MIRAISASVSTEDGAAGGGGRNVECLYARRIVRLFLAVMHLTTGVGPFVDLLGLRDVAERHGGRQQGKELFEAHAKIAQILDCNLKERLLDILLIIKALILGLVEAASEFLPISSTGHLIIVGDFLNFTGPRAEAFEIFIQLGAILAVVWIYRERLLDIALNLDWDCKAQRLVLHLAIAFIPAAILGLLLHKHITHYLFNPVMVAGALVAGGIAILLIERYARTGRVQAVDDMTWKDALARQEQAIRDLEQQNKALENALLNQQIQQQQPQNDDRPIIIGYPPIYPYPFYPPYPPYPPPCQPWPDCRKPMPPPPLPTPLPAPRPPEPLAKPNPPFRPAPAGVAPETQGGFRGR